MRPIASGEVLRRLVGSVLCTLSNDDARDALFLRQVGVGVPLGVEVGAHTARQWFVRNRGAARKVAVKVGFRDAFNCAKRGNFLRAVRRRLPGHSGLL